MSIKFQKNLTFEHIQNILLKDQEGNFSAIPENAKISPLSKGIYFWYIDPTGLKILSKYLNYPIIITEPVAKLGSRILIYLGTAGTRLTENNLGHLRQRLIWHICTKHRPSAIRNGTLSTLRTTLGSLLNDNLISSDGLQTENLINDFMKEYFSVAYLEYREDTTDVINSINEDENLLIKTLRPLLNLKNNPNSRVQGHSTKAIKERRILINNRSKISIQS